jgi:parallel beta-helix repeat protein
MNGQTRATLLPALLIGLFLAGCGGGGDDTAASGPRIVTTQICPGPDAQAKTLVALFDAHEGDTIEFCAGEFVFDTGMILHSKRGITIKGAGRDKTFLTFKESGSSEGINVSHSDGITLQGFTVQDTPGNAVRIFRTKYVTVRDVRTRWRDYQTTEGKALTEMDEGYKPYATNGAYGLYPVEARHVLMEDCEAHGASDAGVYVGQSSDIIVRRCEARFNVAGYEFENTYRAVFEDNVARNNTGGFLVFDLPNLAQYGEKNIVRRNKSYDNNVDNFAPIGNIVGVVPRGTGMLVVSTDQLEIYDNEIYDNDTIGLAMVNFGLAEPGQSDVKYDWFPEAIAVHGNVFRDNGGNPQEPNPDRGEASALPLLLKLRNNGLGAHIVWDGAEDVPNTCETFPKDKDGIPLNLPNPNEKTEDDRYEARVDENGRPNYQRTDRVPECNPGGAVRERKYNKWKFDAAGERVFEKTGLYIADTGRADANVFESTKPETATTTKFLRANITSSDPEQLGSDLITKQGSTDLAPFQTPLQFMGGAYLRPLKLPYVPDTNSAEARPTVEERDAACNAFSGTTPNYAALLRYNCPLLHQYNLFADAKEPRRNANGFAMPFELNSALFSDHAVKYRLLFLPPDAANSAVAAKATYRDMASTGSVVAAMEFPVGTVIAKTFAFRTDNSSGTTTAEDVIETRLLIKRSTSGGGVHWVGLPYVWAKDAGGARTVANLKLEGSTHAVSYDFLDPDPDVKTGTARKRYTGTVEKYGVPAALNCMTCHSGDERESGAAPLGMKPRYLNRAYGADGPSPGENQLAYMNRVGYLSGLPADFGTVEKHPRWNVPGDSGETANSALDVHKRMRAYLEVNCMHCHTGDGGGSNSNLFLDSFRTVDQKYGICKRPVAAGKGAGGLMYDIVPKPDGAEESIMWFRLASAVPGERMPPLARTVVHAEAVSLLIDWINVALPALGDQIENEEACNGAPPSP